MWPPATCPRAFATPASPSEGGSAPAMKLQQLRFLCEVARHGLNVTATAEELYTSQPAISKQLRQLEDELGVVIFARRGKQLAEVTTAGRMILARAERILDEVENIKGVAAEYRAETRGTLSIATTHTQARYALPAVLPALRVAYPELSLHMRQGTTEQIGELASAGEVDFAIAPEGMDGYRNLVMMPCYRWNRCVVVPRKHPLARRRRLRAADLESYPIVTYDAGFHERLPLARDDAAAGAGEDSRQREREDEDAGLNIALSAVDTDVIKTYVRLGFGIGIVARMAYDPVADHDLAVLEAAHLFAPSTVYIGCRQGTFMRQFMIDFVGLFAPHLTPPVIEAAMSAASAEARQALFADVSLPER